MPSVDTYRRPLKSVGKGVRKKTGKALDMEGRPDISFAILFAKAYEQERKIGL